MTKAKHTPGTWLSEGTTLYALNDDGVNRFQASFCPGYMTYSKRGEKQWTSAEEVLANVALAKAAPDLLEALEAAATALEWAKHHLEEAGVESAQVSGTIPEARAAIAKAKGGRDVPAP